MILILSTLIVFLIITLSYITYKNGPSSLLAVTLMFVLFGIPALAYNVSPISTLIILSIEAIAIIGYIIYEHK